MSIETLIRIMLISLFFVFIFIPWLRKFILLMHKKNSLNTIKKHQNNIIREMKGMGWSLDYVSSLPEFEMKILNDNPDPTDADILMYYKMYCKKWQLDHEDEWTTLQPMPFDEWEKRAKFSNKILGEEMIAGGYQFMIPQTCDVMVGIPPNHYFQRFRDYAKIVHEDDKEIMEAIESEIG